MPAIHVLLAAINDYPEGISPLKGCISDLEDMKLFLEEFSRSKGLELNIIAALKDEEATREAIIEGFEKFKDQPKDDICLFYFAGHGKRCETGPAFRALSNDDHLEAIVCFPDKGKKFLFDKEISYLIWKFNQEKKHPFVSIMDCCFSGSMRKLKEITDRQLKNDNSTVEPDDLIGLKEFKKDNYGRLKPPLSPRIHLGASTEKQKAGEVSFSGTDRGIFTYNLTRILRRTNGHITYNQLIIWVNRLIWYFQQNTQIAQLETKIPEYARYYFLSTEQAKDDQFFLLSYRTGKWIINLGESHLQARNINSIYLEVVDEPHLKIKIKKLGQNESQIDSNGMKNMAKRAYVVKLHYKALFYLPEDNDIEANRLVTNFFNSMKPFGADLSQDMNQADYSIHAKDKYWSLALRGAAEILGQKHEGYSSKSFGAFWKESKKIIKWMYVRGIETPSSSIQEDDFELQLYQITERGNYADDAPKRRWDGKSPLEYIYYYSDGKYEPPAIQLIIKNKDVGGRTFFVNVLYMGADYSIKSLQSKEQQIAPQNILRIRNERENGSFLSIPLNLPSALVEGLSEKAHKCYLKIMFTLDPMISSLSFNQEGIYGSLKDVSDFRGNDLKTNNYTPDWKVITIPVTIKGPQE